MNINRTLLQIQIRQDLPHDDAEICLGILNDLLFGDWDLDHITFKDLIFWSPDSDKLTALLPYLTGARTHLLDRKMYFLDDGLRYELTDEQMERVDKGLIYHPASHALLNYEESATKVFMYFSASDLIRGLRK